MERKECKERKEWKEWEEWEEAVGLPVEGEAEEQAETYVEMAAVRLNVISMMSWPLQAQILKSALYTPSI